LGLLASLLKGAAPHIAVRVQVRGCFGRDVCSTYLSE
jgi:hypothetical protein